MTDYVRKVVESDLPMLLEWRNHPLVRQFMYTSHIIDEEEHRNWFQSIENDKRCHLLLYLQQDEPMGFINFGPVKNGGIANWGFYVAPNSPKGTGLSMGKCALDHAFTKLSLHKICGEALEINKISKSFHNRLGFLLEGVRREHFFDGKTYQDIFLFGLLAKRWVQIKNEV